MALTLGPPIILRIHYNDGTVDLPMQPRQLALEKCKEIMTYGFFDDSKKPSPRYYHPNAIVFIEFVAAS